VGCDSSYQFIQASSLRFRRSSRTAGPAVWKHECSANQTRLGTTIGRSVQQQLAQLLAAATLTRREYVKAVTPLVISRLDLAYLLSLHLIFVCPPVDPKPIAQPFLSATPIYVNTAAQLTTTPLIHPAPPLNMAFSFGQQGGSGTPKPSLFGAPSNTSGGAAPTTLFGAANAGSGTPGGAGLFGGGANAGASNPFGGTSNTPASKPAGGLFGSGATSGASSTPSAFGSSLSKPSGETKPSLFGAGGGFGGAAGGATSSSPGFGFGNTACKCLVRAFLAYTG
jgi:hypothetical protein